MILDDALRALLQRAQAAWPQLAPAVAALPTEAPSAFAAFVQRHSASADLAGPHAHQLYLVYAYGAGVPAAQTILETQHLPRVARSLRRAGCPDATAADVIQDLRCRLIEMHDPAIQRAGYSGRSDLSGWLCLSALRAAGLHRKALARERPLEQVTEALAADADPELEALRVRCKDQFQAALREALAALESRERNLLRYHYLSRLTVDQIARLHDIHRATAARRLARAQARLVELTRAAFLARVPMGALSLTQIPALIHSRISQDLPLMLRCDIAAQRPQGGATDRKKY